MIFKGAILNVGLEIVFNVIFMHFSLKKARDLSGHQSFYIFKMVYALDGL
jgi:hypothetical protein